MTSCFFNLIFIFEKLFMKKLLIGLGIMVVSISVFATTTEPSIVKQSSGHLEGRYALDCSKNKAHNLSYVIGDKSILRLISAKSKHALFKSTTQNTVKSSEGYNYLGTNNYQGYRVDFYHKDGQNWAQVKNTSIANFFGPKTSELLMQCKSEIQS